MSDHSSHVPDAVDPATNAATAPACATYPAATSAASRCRKSSWSPAMARNTTHPAANQVVGVRGRWAAVVAAEIEAVLVADLHSATGGTFEQPSAHADVDHPRRPVEHHPLHPRLIQPVHQRSG